MSAGPADAVPHAPLPSPWGFSRLNEHGHVAIKRDPGPLDGEAPPIVSHARVFLGEQGGVIGTAVVYPDGRVEGVVHDHTVGSRLLRHVGFAGVTATFNRITIRDEELGA